MSASASATRVLALCVSAAGFASLLCACGASAAAFPDPGGVTPPQYLLPSPSSGSPHGAHLAGASGVWSVLVLIYPSTDADYVDGFGPGHYTGSLSAFQVSLLQNAAADYAARASEWSAGMVALDVDVHVVSRPITSISPAGSDYWVEPKDLAPELNQYFAGKSYDSVVVLWNQGTIPTYSYWGLAFVGDIEWNSRRFTWATVVYGNYDSGWQGPYPGEVIVHEWMHGLEGYYPRAGYSIPNLHGALAHGYGLDEQNSWKDWYSAMLQGGVIEGCQLTGMSKSVWQSGAVNHESRPAPPQLRWPVGGECSADLPVLRWSPVAADDFLVRLCSGQSLLGSFVAGPPSAAVPPGILPGAGAYGWSVTTRSGPDLAPGEDLLTFSYSPSGCSGLTERVSVNTAGQQSSGQASMPSVSGSGRFVAFSSDASDLGRAPPAGSWAVYRRDRETGETSQLALTPGSGPVPTSLSFAGRHVAFSSKASNLVVGDTNGREDVFVWDALGNQIERVSLTQTGDQTLGGGSWNACISGDARFVVFNSSATNFSPGGGVAQVYIRDRDWSSTALVSVSSSGEAANAACDTSRPALSADGHFVAFASEATNLVQGDANGASDIFVRDTLWNTTERVSASDSGAEAHGASLCPSVSADGRYVAFCSDAPDLVAGDTNGQADVFVRDRTENVTFRVSLASSGEQAAGGPSDQPSISPDGRYVAFRSSATNLAPGDTNGSDDVFVHDLLTGETVRASVSSTGAQANGPSGDDGAQICGNGRCVTFSSLATNLVVGDNNGNSDAFVRQVCGLWDQNSVLVTNTHDSGPGSLRRAISTANQTGGRVIVFNIPTGDPGFNGQTFTIQSLTPLPIITAPGTQLDGASQTAFAGDTAPNGPEVHIDGSLIPPNDHGLNIQAAYASVHSLAIDNCPGHGIILWGEQTHHVRVTGCHLVSNLWQGLEINGRAHDNIVGGKTVTERNLVSGNKSCGIAIYGNANANVVRGNFVGTDAAGLAAFPNTSNGVDINWGASNNVVGGLEASARNVISGNGVEGVAVCGTGSTGNVVQGNYIGTDASGTAAIPNEANGVEVNWDTDRNIIGGTQPGAGNLISGNRNIGLVVYGTGTTGNVVQGNLIGTDRTGQHALGNGNHGIEMNWDTTHNRIGGVEAAARNIVSGNGGSGIAIYGGITADNTVAGNFIGTDATGVCALGNGSHGMDIAWGTHDNAIGLPGAGNLICANHDNGINFYGHGTDRNLIVANQMGISSAGAALPNGQHGIEISGGASHNVIGADIPAGWNRIGLCTSDGIRMWDGNSLGNTIGGNAIFSSSDLGINLIGGSENGYGVTGNDSGDGDDGPNGLQNYPVLSSAAKSGSGTRVVGTLASRSNAAYLIRFYSSDRSDPSGYGEGAAYFGSAAVTTNASGNAPFDVTLPLSVPEGRSISATATDADGSTSEFANAVILTGPAQARPMVIRARDCRDPIALAASASYELTFAGRVTARDASSFILDDGSTGSTGALCLLKVLASGHTLQVGDLARASGALDSLASPPTLTCTPAGVAKLN